MSEILVNGYSAEIDRLRRITGRTTEQIVREAFKDLLKDWSKARGLHFAAELEYLTAFKTKVYPDGTVLHDLRVPLGFWEAKDTFDDLDARWMHDGEHCARAEEGSASAPWRRTWLLVNRIPSKLSRT